MIRKVRKTLTLTGALLVASFAATTAAQADTGLVVVTTTGKVPVTKNMDVDFYCSANCAVSITAQLKVPGPDVFTSDTGQFTAGAPARYTTKITKKRALKFLHHEAKRCKLKVTFDATNLDTGATDHVERTFKLKK